MARSNTANVKFDVQEVERLAKDLSKLSGEEIGKASVTALNEVIDRTYELSRDKMISGINLSDDYLRRRMTVASATPAKPVASITASGARKAMSVLGRFDAKPVLVANKKKTNTGMVGPRKLPFPAGQRQAGVTVEVTRGDVSDGFVPRGFLLPLKKGTEAGGNGLGVFARTKEGKLRHRYGPSVYQLFAYQVEHILNDVTDDLEDTLTEQVALAMQKAIEP